MSTLIIEVCRVKEIRKHKGADFLEIAVLKGWECIIKKNQYKVGDIVIYIPPDAILPQSLIEELGIENYLTGKNKDRVRCARLRGTMSYGLVMNIPEDKNWEVGYNCQEDLKIKKYLPPVRAIAGDRAPEDPFFDKYTDMENIRNYPDVFKDGEEVVVTEKIDGTNFRGNITLDEEGKILLKAGSHNVKRKRPETDEEFVNNTYWFPWSISNVKDMMIHLNSVGNKNVILYGEIYGAVRGGHKSMHYGKQGTLNFAAFDLKIDGNYIDWEEFEGTCAWFNVPIVPIIDKIKFNFDKIKELSRGFSILADRNGFKHLREGCVVKPIKEREERGIGRVVLKVINEDFLVLKEKKAEKGEIVDYTDE